MIAIDLNVLLTVVLCAGQVISSDTYNIIKKRSYTHLIEPKEHPDYNRRHVQPPSWEIFDYKTQFTSLRGFAEKDGEIVNYKEEIEKYTRIHQLGDILWTAYPIIFGKNLDEVIDEIKRRGLFLFDIWGYVPGSGPGGYWQQFKPPDGVFDLLELKLGDHWLGMDVGEQDGRYIGGYAPQMFPSSADRFHQYLYFQRHFQKMCDELGNKMCTLVSLNFGHYFLKEGVYSLIGAETAQALPNSQVYYAFIRGAGKQYGVPWFGNVSVFNRWGYKNYASIGDDHSPTKGTSLNLMKRLMISHILYNCMLVGFESGWFNGDELTPIGHLQKETKQWVEENGQLGVMQTPVALMLDFFSGWSFPRHLYTSDVYRVWGNLPYNAGDYLADNLLDMLYPKYQDSSYFHDETGFMTPTPYGDIADCILSDAEQWLLDRYSVIILAGEISVDLELRDKLQSYIEQGGILVITAGNLAKLKNGLANVKANKECLTFKAGTEIKFDNEILIEENPFELMSLTYPKGTRIIGTCENIPFAIELQYGKGRLIVLASPFGISSETVNQNLIRNEVDKHLVKPYPILKHTNKVIDKILCEQMLFEVGKDLAFIVCRKSQGEYTIGIFNNSLHELPFNIVSHIGEIKSINELPLKQSEKQAIGYLPEGFEDIDVGISRDNIIAGGDVRVFNVKVNETGIEEIPHIKPSHRRKGIILPLSDIMSIKEAILAKPTFFEHFDGVVVDWRYLHEKEKSILQQESGWIQRQGLRIFVDLTSGINLYPDLRLLNNSEENYNNSMDIISSLLEKMDALNSKDFIISLHRIPENNFTIEESWKSFDETVRHICSKAEKYSIKVYLRMCQGKPPWNLQEAVNFIDRVGTKNLSIAPNIGLLLGQKVKSVDISDYINNIGLWLVSTPEYDIVGKLWNTNARLSSGDWHTQLKEMISINPQIPVVFDAIYKNWDEIYQDVKIFK